MVWSPMAINACWNEWMKGRKLFLPNTCDIFNN